MGGTDRFLYAQKGYAFIAGGRAQVAIQRGQRQTATLC
jgi:hypothetical protein